MSEGYRGKKQFCPVHRIPMLKRQCIKEGEDRFFCVKCLEAKKT